MKPKPVIIHLNNNYKGIFWLQVKTIQIAQFQEISIPMLGKVTRNSEGGGREDLKDNIFKGKYKAKKTYHGGGMDNLWKNTF